MGGPPGHLAALRSVATAAPGGQCRCAHGVASIGPFRGLSGSCRRRCDGQPTDSGTSHGVIHLIDQAGVIGKPMVDTVRVRQACRMRLAADGISVPLVAEQWYAVEPPGFVWDATVPIAGVPVVRGRDGYVDGRGMMAIKAGSVFPIVDAAGPEMDQASLTRYLSEMPWFPSAFLRERVTWEAVDDTTVRVTLADGDLRASGTMTSIPTAGSSSSARNGTRWSATATSCARYELRPWSAPTHGYGEFEGLRLPVRGAAVWTMPDGTDLPYLEIEVTDITSDPPIPV